MPPIVFPICLYREVMHLQCFMPTRTRYKRDYLYLFAQNRNIGSLQACIVWLYYMHTECSLIPRHNSQFFSTTLLSWE